MKYFYQKYIVYESVLEKLNELDLSEEERVHLSALVDSTLHHAIMDEILSNLSNEDKRLFLKQVHDDPEDEKVMEFLKGKITDIEQRIEKVSKQLSDELHQDIKESKEK